MVSLTTASKIKKLQEQIKKLEQKENAVSARKQGKALQQIKALAASNDLSAAQVAAALAKPGRGTSTKTPGEKKAAVKSKLVGRKIPPKYRNPDNSLETWAGRGRAPKWVADLRAAGKLETALIS